MDGGAWWASVLRLVLQSWSRLKQLSMCACRHTLRGCGLLKPSRDFSEVQGLRFCAPNKAAWVPSLVRELRSHMPCDIARKKKRGGAEKWAETKWDTNGASANLVGPLVNSHCSFWHMSNIWQSFLPDKLNSLWLLVNIISDVLCLVAQSRSTFCDPMDCSPPGSSVHVDFPGKNTGVGSHALLQGIFPTQGLNWGLLHCR